jgi:hypothetical protein
MKVLHVVGKKMEEISTKGDSFEFLDGDVYVVDNGNDIWIWIGKDCGVEEKTVGAWVANKLDNEKRGGEPSVYSVSQGEEPEDFKKLLEFTVIDGDTPGFLVHAELDIVDFKMFRVFIKEDTEALDDTSVEEVPLKRGSLKSEDVFVVDGNESIYMWVGEKSQREESFGAQKVMQTIDSERNYLPLTYTIYEGEGGKSEEAFYKMIGDLAERGSDVSVEDKRELEFRPEGGETPEEARERLIKSSKSSEPKSEPKEKKKGLFARLFGIFR